MHIIKPVQQSPVTTPSSHPSDEVQVPDHLPSDARLIITTPRTQALTILTRALVLGIMTLSASSALAQTGEARLSAKMVSSAASGKADYRERGHRRRLNVEAKDLSNSTPSSQTVFVNGAPVGNMTLVACPNPAAQLLSGELKLNTQDRQSVPVITRGQIVSIGTNPAVLAGVLR